MTPTADRAYDDDAPILAGDVESARSFLRLKRVAMVVLTPVAVMGAIMGSLMLLAILKDVVAQRRCVALREHSHAALEAELPATMRAKPDDTFTLWPGAPDTVVIHRGDDGYIVVDAPNVAALMKDGRVVASTLRCGRGDNQPRTAWWTPTP
jgi:hypothetical protein